MSYQSICEELPLLSRKQLDEIRKRCALLMQQQSTKSDSVEDQDWILEGILHECQHRGIYVGRSFHIKRTGSFAAFATKSEALRELLTECAPGLTPVQYVALGQVCARELANHLTIRFNTPQVSFKAMMDRVEWIPAALEESFPGYMQSRLLSLVVPFDVGH
jgi:hypothetical protein